MYDSCKQVRVRVLNQSTQFIKTIVRATHGVILYDVTGQVILAGKSEYICIPERTIPTSDMQQGILLKDFTIYMYAFNSVTAQWIEFAVVPVESLTVNLLWVTEVNGSAVLTPYGCDDLEGTNGTFNYLKLRSRIMEVMRLYVGYDIGDKYYSKKMSAVAAGRSGKVWVPVEGINIVVKSQYWYWGWRDINVYNWHFLKDNICFVGRYTDEDIGINTKIEDCSE